MNIILFLLLVLAMHPLAHAQLADFSGEWRVQCHLTPAVAGVDSFAMSLKVLPDSDGATWVMINEASGALPRQVRNYRINKVDATLGHYVIDEGNGLLLGSLQVCDLSKDAR